jgi:hypothetical protein
VRGSEIPKSHFADIFDQPDIAYASSSADTEDF